MLKPHSLRAHLTAATPELRRDPDKLSVFVRDGRLVAAGAESLSFEYRYALNVVVLDYAGQADAIMVPLLAWLRANQVEILENPALRDKSVRFEVEYLNKETVDISIEVDLTEAVVVSPGEDPTAPDSAKRYTVAPAAEPAREGALAAAEHWEAWSSGELLAEWRFPATEP
ncbi:phage tail protein [Variovorax sp. YR216]|uniref:phage tail protein n=1 Tax=Variovorax sp. YR216 TaxID=1882828 RepID=UPI00089C56F1|nr:phage tail protein [Variovorax sp. YR216]SEA50699.1 P2 phage tail completion protein R (GpR) [Variovorax sp. YR216]